MHLLGRPVDKKAPEPAHVQVRRRLVDLIHQGKLRPGDRLPPEPEVAYQLGVSRMTANKAILGLVLEGWLVREKGKGTFVAGAPPGTTVRCAVAIPADPIAARDDHYFGALYWSLQAELHHNAVDVQGVKLAPGISEEIESSGADALIAINPSETLLEDLKKCSRGGRPVVIVGASWGDCGLSLVDSDNLLGAALAVNHLADLGHRRIYFFGACPNDSNTIDRVRGFRRALKARHLPVRLDWEAMMPTAFGLDPVVEAKLVRDLISPDRPTAVFAAGARLAMRVMGLAQQNGLRIPEDLSVVAYDDPEFLKLAYPPISTVRQPLGAMAAEACALVLNLLKTDDKSPCKVVVDPELIVRGSSDGPPD